MNLEDYIKDLAPELQEKARACGSIEELVALAKEADVAVPDEALAAIAGGADVELGCSHKTIKCPRCGSTNVKDWLDTGFLYCLNCGYTFVP